MPMSREGRPKSDPIQTSLFRSDVCPAGLVASPSEKPAVMPGGARRA